MIKNYGLIGNTKFHIACAVLGCFLLGLSALLEFKAPQLIENKIWETKVLTNGTEQWDMFMEMPFPFTFKVYIFNIENADEILLGEKPVVKEVGPYVYNLYYWKEDVVWHTKEELSYHQYMRFEYNAYASGNRSDSDEVVVLNSAYNALLYKAESTFETVLSGIPPALPGIFGNYNSPFMKLTVKELLFDGIRLCDSKGPFKKAGGFVKNMICSTMIQMTNVAKPMRYEDGAIIMANFYFKNNTHQGTFRIKTGHGDPKDTAILKSYDGMESLRVWRDGNTTCNRVGGITTVFPAKIDTGMILTSFSDDICRSISMGYKRTEKVKGVCGYRFVALETTFEAPKYGTDNYCFCINKSRTLDGEVGCLSDGLLDMSRCMGAPVLLSFPHLLHADQTYLDSVDGLKADPELHETFVLLEPLSGTPVSMAKRVQFNMILRPVARIPILENVTNAVIPMFWIEESTIIPDKYVDIIKSQLLFPLKLLKIAKWVILVWGMALIGIPFFLYVYTRD